MRRETGNSLEIHVGHLLGRKVIDANGKKVGRIEELTDPERPRTTCAKGDLPRAD